MDSVDVTFSLIGDPKINSRALRQLKLLSELGLSVLVLGLGSASGMRKLDIQNVHLKYLPQPIGSGPRFFWRNHQQLKSALRNVRSKVFHASDLYTLPAMHRAAMSQQAHLVFDSRELYTHLPATNGRPWVRAVWEIIYRLHIRDADCVYTVSDSIARHLKDQYQLTSVHVMHNVPGPQITTKTNSLRMRLNLPSDVKIILYQGNLQRHRGVRMMVEAMCYTDHAVLIFMGAGTLRPETQELAQTLGLSSKIYFLDPVPSDELLSVTSSADIGLTFLEDCCLNHRYALPNKLFEYLTAGIPVIASDLPEITQLIKRFNVGCVVPSGDSEALGNALDHALKHEALRKSWAANTSRVLDSFNFRTESERFITPYQSLLNL